MCAGLWLRRDDGRLDAPTTSPTGPATTASPPLEGAVPRARLRGRRHLLRRRGRPARRRSRRSGVPIVTVKVQLTNQDGAVLVDGDGRGRAAALRPPAMDLSIVSRHAAQRGAGARRADAARAILREVTARFAEREALVLAHGERRRALDLRRAVGTLGRGGARADRLRRRQGQPRRHPDDQPAGVARGRVRHRARRRRGRDAQHVLDAAGAGASAAGLRRLDPAVRAPRAKKDFAAILGELEPRSDRRAPGGSRSTRFPFLRRLAMVGERHGDARRSSSWADFLARGRPTPRAAGRGDGRRRRRPPTSAVLFFSSGSTSRPKGILQLAPRRRHPVVALAAACTGRPRDDVRCWTANGFFWSGNFCDGARQHPLGRRHARAAADLRGRGGARADAGGAGDACPFAWPHQWAQLEAAPNWNCASI